MHYKNLLIILSFLSVFTACKQEKVKIVSTKFADSLISYYHTPAAIHSNASEMEFWKKRIVPGGDITNESKYAALLVGRFNLSGDIRDVKQADSIMLRLAAEFNDKEAGPYIALTAHSILQHRFKEAAAYLNTAKTIGVKRYEYYSTAFDVNFETGDMYDAMEDLKNIAAENDFGYQFRKSKMAHYNGALDSSIAFMQKAYALAGQSIPMQQIALSNVGDLYIHAGKLEQAYDSYVQCIKMNPADLHSIMGIGWIALVHDNNDSLAERIFHFVQSKTKSPEPLFKLIMVAQQRHDSVLEYKYAKEFETLTSDTLYGNMYNKYLIQLYTGVLNDPAKAEMLASKELKNRSTSQTYAWYAWSLLANHKKEEAYTVYEKNISGQPLEGLELYYMGKLMKELQKGYNAQQYFKEASKNKYDLSPRIYKDLQKSLEE